MFIIGFKLFFVSQVNYQSHEIHSASQQRYDEGSIGDVEVATSLNGHTAQVINETPAYETLTLSVNFVHEDNTNAGDIGTAEVQYIYQDHEISQPITQEVSNFSCRREFYLKSIYFRCQLLSRTSARSKQKRNSSKTRLKSTT